MEKKIISIIGAGPAGITAAIQLKRYGRNVQLFERDEIGGLIRNAFRVDNYLGFHNGISGKQIVNLFKMQLKKFSISPIFNEISSVEYIDNCFQLNSYNSVYFSDYCIIATGTKPNEPNNTEIDESARKYCFYEVKHLEKINKKNIGIIGSGDAAFDYAASLSRTNKVSILCRSEKHRAIQILANEVLSNENVTFENNVEPLKILKKNTKLLVICNSQGCQIEKNFDLLLFAIGRHSAIPEIKFAPNPKKLFVIGDAEQSGLARQISIASGNAMMTAMKLHHLILNEGNENNSRNR